jgi:dynein heavy chain
MRGQRLLLRSVKLEEPLVTGYMDKAMEVFKANTLGPQKYLKTYKDYNLLLNNKAEHEVTSFLKEKHSLQGFKSVSVFCHRDKYTQICIGIFKLFNAL